MGLFLFLSFGFFQIALSGSPPGSYFVAISHSSNFVHFNTQTGFPYFAISTFVNGTA